VFNDMLHKCLGEGQDLVEMELPNVLPALGLEHEELEDKLSVGHTGEFGALVV
jgi:hypothetical protein